MNFQNQSTTSNSKSVHKNNFISRTQVKRKYYRNTLTDSLNKHPNEKFHLDVYSECFTAFSECFTCKIVIKISTFNNDFVVYYIIQKVVLS